MIKCSKYLNRERCELSRLLSRRKTFADHGQTRAKKLSWRINVQNPDIVADKQSTCQRKPIEGESGKGSGQPEQRHSRLIDRSICSACQCWLRMEFDFSKYDFLLSVCPSSAWTVPTSNSSIIFYWLISRERRQTKKVLATRIVLFEGEEWKFNEKKRTASSGRCSSVG